MKRRKKRYINHKGRSVPVFIIWSYIEKILDSTKTLLELINNFSKVAGYKINIQKSESFPYKNNTWKRKKPNSLTRALEAMKYLGINLTKEVKSWNCKMLMKETEDDTNKWKHTHVHHSEELILLKCQYYRVRFSAVSIKILIAFFMEIRTILKFVMALCKTPISQSNAENEEQSCKCHTPWFQM